MNDAYLLLWLESPLQSWGFDSKFGRRDTLNFPTKSGVLGLLCCALGAGGEQRELLATMASKKSMVIAFSRSKQNKALPMEPLLHDFHMVGSGYCDENPWESLLIPRTSNGKKAVGGGSKITHRFYLQDAYFAAIIEVPEPLADEFSNALQNPVWDLYLGRKNCAPTDFIFRGRFDNESDAVVSGLQLAKEKQLLEAFRVLDGEHEGEQLILQDVPIQFGPHKLYRDRRVTVTTHDE